MVVPVGQTTGSGIKFGKSAHRALEVGALIAASTTLKT